MSALEIGRRYDVEISDCCVEASFTATLVEILDREEPVDDEEFLGYLFDNGVRVEPGWHGGVNLRPPADGREWCSPRCDVAGCTSPYDGTGESPFRDLWRLCAEHAALMGQIVLVEHSVSAEGRYYGVPT